MTFTTVQQQAKYRVSLKRQLRLKGIEFNNQDSTEKLEALTKENRNEVEVTFDKFSPKGLAGKTVKAIKTVKVHTREYVEYGVKRVYSWESVSYLYDGQYYGEEFFVA